MPVVTIQMYEGRSREQKDRDWETVVKMFLIARDLLVGERRVLQRAEHLVDVYEGRLQLHDQQVSGLLMPRQLVNRSPLAVDRERHLGLDHPTRFREHEGREALGEHRVSSAQKPVQFAASPPGDELRPNVQSGCHPSDSQQRQLLAMTALDERDGGTRDARQARQICLAEATPRGSSA